MDINNYLAELKKLRTQREMESCDVLMDDLVKTIDCARLGASAMNAQRVRFALVADKDIAKKLWLTTNLPTKHEIPEEQAASAFIILGIEEDKSPDFIIGLDAGIYMQIIREALHKLGYASVDLHSFDRKVFNEIIGVNNFYAINVIAIGKSNQNVILEDSEEVGTYKDEDKTHIVRKLTTDHLIVKKI
jgi:nitroreductase